MQTERPVENMIGPVSQEQKKNILDALPEKMKSFLRPETSDAVIKIGKGLGTYIGRNG